MNVVICNSDPAVARVARRILTQGGYGVVEVSNGLDVIRTLEKESIDGLVIEADMPVMGALETLRILRDSSRLAELPAVVLTSDPDDASIRQFIALGVHDILVQVVSPEKLAARLEATLQTMTWDRRHADRHEELRTSPKLGQESVVLMVDGDSEYRQYFKKVVAGRFKILEAESGVQALEATHRPLPDAVLIGTGLGLVTPERIIQRLRAVPGRSVQIIGIPPKSEAALLRSSGLYDEVIARTYIPAILERELARLLPPSSAFGILSQAVPDIRSRIIRAAEQVFGVMLMTDVEPTDGVFESGEGPLAAITITTPTLVATLRLQFDVASGHQVAGAFLEMDPDGLAAEDVVSVVGEVANVLTGRIKAAFEERGIEASIGLPDLSASSSGGMQGAAEVHNNGLVLPFKAIDRPVAFRIELTAERAAQPKATVDEETGVLALRTDTPDKESE